MQSATPAVTVRVPAKINLGLAVGPRRSDGFHSLHTVFAGIDLYDTVTVRSAPTRSLQLTGPEAAGLAADRSNLAWRAAERLSLTAAITVDKQIPVAAGLAGGSADAAGVLLAGTRLSGDGAELAAIAAELGSDVAFALSGGLAVGRARGECLTALDGAPLHWVLAAAETGLSTPAAYAELDRIRPRAATPALADELIDAVRQGDLETLSSGLRNDLEPAALNLMPELAATLATGRRLGALTGLVSGSGPTCLFLVADRTQADALVAELQGHCRFARAVVSGARTTIEVS